jgi:CheY-like chemotaxis protein
VEGLPEHDVTLVSRAAEAFALFSSGETFDVILCDLMMPRLGGRDVLERLEAEWPHLAAAMIFMTGGAFTAEAREFLSHVKEAVLVKPFSIDQLRMTIMMHLQARIRGRN